MGLDTQKEKRYNYMKKIATVMIAAVLCVMCFAGCDKYTSKYNAVAFVHSNEAHTASMSFSEFEGYDCDGTKKGLYTVKEGEKQKLLSTV